MFGAGRTLVIGLGCSSSATGHEVVELITRCLDEAQLSLADVLLLATHERRRSNAALSAAATWLGLPLHALNDGALAPGVPGTCEAVAAAAGALILPKRKSRFVTCAIARCNDAFSPVGFGQPVIPSAAMAASTLVTSGAGS